jgi:hypothetical protein
VINLNSEAFSRLKTGNEARKSDLWIQGSVSDLNSSWFKIVHKPLGKTRGNPRFFERLKTTLTEGFDPGSE